MSGADRRGAALLVTLGFVLSVLAAAGMPAGAAGGRQPSFAVEAKFQQAGAETASYDYNTGGPLTINLTITNTGDPASRGNVTLGYRDDYFGLVDLKSWGPMELSNTEPTLLNFTWGFPVMSFAHNPAFFANVSEGSVYINESFPITVKVAVPSVTSVQLASSNANPTTLVLGVDELTVTTTIKVTGNQDLAGGTLTLWLDDYEAEIAQTEIGPLALNAEKSIPLTTNLSGVSVSYGEHFITVEASSGNVGASNTSASFNVVQAMADVQLTEVLASPTELTIHTGESQNVTVTAGLANNGTAGARDFPVFFYVDEAMTPAATVDVNETIPAGGTMNVTWNWTVTDTTPLGNHTLYVGVGGQTDWPYWAQVNVSVMGQAHLFIENITVFPEVEFEGSTVTITVKVANDGTENALDAPVSLLLGAETIETKNVTVPKGSSEDVQFVWTLPEVEADTELALKATVAEAEMTANLTVRNRTPVLNITDFVVPAELRIGDEAEFKATIKNEGSGDAIGLLVEFYDNTTKLAEATVNLTAGSTRDVVAMVNITGVGDVNHTFYVKALGAERNVTVMVGHRLAPANIVVSSFTVKPKKKENQPKDSTQSYTLTITLKNTGELPGIVYLNLTEGKKLLTPLPVPLQIEGGKEVTQNITWKVKGDGKHTAVAKITGDAAGTPSTMSVSCELHYTPGFEVLLLAAAIVVAAALIRRRKK